METQETISAWAEETFGPAGSDLRVVARANEEMAEVIRALSFGGQTEKAIEECADTAIVLMRLADRMKVRVVFPNEDAAWDATTYAIWASAALNRLLDELHKTGGRDPVSPWAQDSFSQAVENLGKCVDALNGVIEDAINRKMAINRAREWRLDGSGHGYHVKGDCGLMPVPEGVA